MSQTPTNFAAFLKEIVKAHEDTTYEPSPALALMSKDENFYGESMRLPLKIGDVQGGSATFAEAQSGASGSSSVERAFSLTHCELFSLAQLSGSVIRRSEKEAILKALDTEVESAMNTLACDLSHQLYRNGYGSRGAIAGVSGSTFQCANADDVMHIKKGMRLVFSESEAGHVLRSATVRTVTAVDEETNTVTLDGTMAGVSAVNGDHVFRSGDRENSATPARLVYSGVKAWIPSSVSATTFFGVDRTVDRVRLAGRYWAAAATPPEEVLIDGLRKLRRVGGKASHAFVPTAFFAALTKQLQSRGTLPLVDVKVTPRVGFRGIDLVGAGGSVTVLDDIYCPPDMVWLTNIADWSTATAGKMVRLADEDGLKVSRSGTADTFEARFVSEGNFACRNPLNNIHINITAY